MINIRYLEIVLADQAEELQLKGKHHYCRRPEEELVELDSPLAQVVIGVRRCGKSTLCYTALTNAGVNFAYVNFDDERLAMVNAEDLNPILEVLYKINGSFTHLFLDEIQNVEGWHLFVNRLLRRDIRVIITGSNAKLLSGELATHLTGRHHVINLFPLSFAEFCDCTGVETRGLTTEKVALRRKAFDEYVRQGGFPELLHIKSQKNYIRDLTNNILQRDIEQRFNIRHTRQFENMAQHLMNVAPVELQYSLLGEQLGIASAHTVQKYVGYLCQAYMLLSLHKYSPKSRQRLVGNKAYCVDVAFMDKRPDAFSGDNFGWRLETIVFLELKRRALAAGMDLYYLKDGRSECDFIVCDGNRAIEAYQVSFAIYSPRTYRREINGLLMAANKTKCANLTLITDHAYDDVEVDGKKIKIRPAYEWVLGNN